VLQIRCSATARQFAHTSLVDATKPLFEHNQARAPSCIFSTPSEPLSQGGSRSPTALATPGAALTSMLRATRASIERVLKAPLPNGLERESFAVDDGSMQLLQPLVNGQADIV
jgi:hypothetical protein